MLDLIDIGANLTHDSFDADRDAVLARAAAAGVARIIVTGTSRHEQRASGGAMRGASRQRCSRRPACIRTMPPSSTRTRLRRCARCSRLRRSSPSANAASISFATTRRAPRSGARSRHSSSSRPKSVNPCSCTNATRTRSSSRCSRPCGASLAGGVAHCFTGGPKELDAYLDARSPHRRHGLGLRRAPRRRAARGRAADSARPAAASRPTRRTCCRAISSRSRAAAATSRSFSRTCSSASQRSMNAARRRRRASDDGERRAAIRPRARVNALSVRGRARSLL